MSILVKTQTAVMRTLYQIQVKHNRTWSWAKRSTIQKYLKKYYRISVSLSDISYHLLILHKADLIRVFTRYGRDCNGTVFQLPSNRQITGKGVMYLKRYGISVKNWLYNWAFNGIRPARNIAKSTPYNQPNTFTRQPRRSASPPEILENVLSDTLNSLK